jgi:pyroglutamyl-peptidase
VKPVLVICVGQAGGRTGISVERVAINVDDARIPDNAGKSPIDDPIVKRGPVGYWSSLPIKAIVLALREAGLPAEVSQSAGTFVCNHVFYGLMHLLAKGSGRGGFVHVPYTPEQTARMKSPAPSLALADQRRGIEVVIRTALITRRDVRAAGGATH